MLGNASSVQISCMAVIQLHWPHIVYETVKCPSVCIVSSSGVLRVAAEGPAVTVRRYRSIAAGAVQQASRSAANAGSVLLTAEGRG